MIDRRQSDGYRYAALGIGVVIIIFDVSALTAWGVHFSPLIQPSPGMPVLTRQGAFLELLLGLGLASLALGRKRITTICASIVLILTVLVAFEYVSARNLGIDEILGKDYIQHAAPGRISPTAALCYFAAAIALLALSARMGRRYAAAVAGIIGSILSATGLVMFLTYSLGHIFIYHWGSFRAISVQASGVVVFLGAGIFLLALDENRSRKSSSSWLPIAVALSLSAGTLGVWQALLAYGQEGERDLLLLSHTVLAGGILGALLVAITLNQAQKARLRSRQLQERKEAFEIWFEASPDALLVVNREGRIVNANQRTAVIFGYPRAEVPGSSIESLIPINPQRLQTVHLENYARLPGTRPMGEGTEVQGRRNDGSAFPVEVYLSPLQTSRGAEVLATVRDITQRREAEEALRQSEERFRNVFDKSPLGIALVDPNYRFVSVNAALCRMVGYSEEELVGSSPLEFTHPDDREAASRFEQSLVKREISFYKMEKRFVKRNGEIIWTTLTASALRDGEGRLLYVLGMLEDITARRQAEDAVRESEERFRNVFEKSPLGLALIQPDYRLSKVNASLCRMSGYSESELTGMSPFDITFPEDRERTLVLARRLFDGEIPSYQVEKRYVKKNGEIMWATMSATVVRDGQGRMLYGLGALQDITERKHAQEALLRSEERFRGLIEQGPLGITLVDRQFRLLKVNAALCDMLGYTEVELTGKTPLAFTHPDDRPSTTELTERLFQLECPIRRMEKRYVRKNGEVIWGSVSASVIRNQQGKPIYAMGMIEDITERKRAEEEMRTLSERLSQAVRFASMSVWEWDPRTRDFLWDDAAFEMAGIPKIVPLPYELWARSVHPDDRPQAEAALLRVLLQKTQESMEFRMIRPDNQMRYVYASGGPILDQHGNVARIVGIVADITQRKRLEQELEAAREQAITSARLSALGMMAGGVAHEINNPLSIIHAMASDLSEMVAEQGAAPPQIVARKSAVIRETAQRIAKIVRSLRHISREGASDPFRPTPLNKIVGETLEICRAKFRANGVELRLPSAIPNLSVPCREVQIAQSLLNLLQNAFDAVVEQEGVRWVRLDVEHRYHAVVLSVVDNGPGIPSDIRPHIMEPFFTTKPVGKGTGLGLSLSKTIAEDHGGSLEYNEDQGHTRFSLVLPLAIQAEAA